MRVLLLVGLLTVVGCGKNELGTDLGKGIEAVAQAPKNIINQLLNVSEKDHKHKTPKQITEEIQDNQEQIYNLENLLNELEKSENSDTYAAEIESLKDRVEILEVEVKSLEIALDKVNDKVKKNTKKIKKKKSKKKKYCKKRHHKKRKCKKRKGHR